MRFRLALLALFATGAAFTQSWEWARQIGGPGPDGAYIGAVDTNGNVYVYGSYAMTLGPTGFQGCLLGEDTLVGSEDAFIAKFDAEGNLGWVKTLTGPDQVFIGGLTLDESGGSIYITGRYFGQCSMDTCTLVTSAQGAFLAKWSTDGHCLWAQTIATCASSAWGWTSGLGITQDANGDLIISLRTDELGITVAGGQLIPAGTFLAKYAPDGTELWVKSFTTFNSSMKGIFLHTLRYSEGRVYAHGPAYMQSEGDTTVVDTIQVIGRHGNGYALASIDPESGVAEWLRLDGFPSGSTGPQSMGMDANGRVYCVGSFLDTAVFGEEILTSQTDHGKAYLSKYLTTGEPVLARGYEGTDDFGFLALDVDAEGKVAATGYLRGGIEFGGSLLAASTSQDMFVAVMDSVGNGGGMAHVGVGLGGSIRWSEGGMVVCGVFPGSLTPTGSITIGSETFASHGYEDVFLAKHGALTSVPQSMALEETGLGIYANPNRGSFRLRLPSALAHETELLLRIYDGTGRQVAEQLLSMNEERPQLDVWDVGPGFYMVTVSNGKRTYSGSMVVE
ncbi:MAG: T9SS type A sorting domain-containing protein [Flavobacteriales bacterium]|nr:T9SS type A sorting domain-containing protein [Flavobacteriales bacterium]